MQPKQPKEKADMIHEIKLLQIENFIAKVSYNNISNKIKNRILKGSLLSPSLVRLHYWCYRSQAAIANNF